MFTIENIKTQQIYTHVESSQKVSFYPDYTKGTYTPRFHVHNYKPSAKQHKQRSFKAFKNFNEATKWADRVCNMLPKEDAGDVHAITKIVKGIKHVNA